MMPDITRSASIKGVCICSCSVMIDKRMGCVSFFRMGKVNDTVKSMWKRPDLLLLALTVATIVALWNVFAVSPGDVRFSVKEDLIAQETEKGETEYVDIPKDGAPIRFMMFNVQNYFVPQDTRRSTYRIYWKSNAKKEAVADVIASRNPDAVGLIEIGGYAALADLRERLKKRGLIYSECFVLERSGEDRALAILSRVPIERNDSQANQRLFGERNRTMLRGILDVTLKTEDERLFRILGVHLKSKVSDDPAAADSLRRREATTLAHYVHHVQQKHPNLPLLLFGDFNDDPTSPSVQIIERGIGKNGIMRRLTPTDKDGEEWTLYYAAEHAYSVYDHIFVNKTLSSRIGIKYASGITESKSSVKAGDHRALWCDLR